MTRSHNVGDPQKRHDHHRGLRTVAIVEALKGVLVVVAGFVFVEVIRRDVDLQDATLNLLYVLHIDPDRRISLALLHAAERMSDANLLYVVAIVLSYSSLRFVESYGLWRQRAWAEWLAIVSGAIYLPFELIALIRHPSRGALGGLVSQYRDRGLHRVGAMGRDKAAAARVWGDTTGARRGLRVHSFPTDDYGLAAHSAVETHYSGKTSNRIRATFSPITRRMSSSDIPCCNNASVISAMPLESNGSITAPSKSEPSPTCSAPTTPTV